MPPKLDFSKEFGSKYTPEDKDQALVVTPYGKGAVIRTRQKDVTSGKTVRDIELVDWNQALSMSNSGPVKPHMLYSTESYPSIPAEVGSEVLTQWGRGKVTEIRNDSQKTHVVMISNWRLAGRSRVKCFVAARDIQVVKPHKIYDMSVFEKVEHANELKEQAAVKFAVKDWEAALEICAKAIDTVRYVQHGSDSTNEVRADLIVIMITCGNNCATCCVQLKKWQLAEKYAVNALVLVDALEKRKDESKIRKIINRDGIGDSQLFGAWKAKSLLVIGKCQMERHEAAEAIQTLKKALDAILFYKKEGDTMFKRLFVQEKEMRRLYAECMHQIMVDKEKEKQRARAMFGGTEDKKDVDTKNLNRSQPSKAAEGSSDKLSPRSVTAVPSSPDPLKKKVSFADGKSPGDADDKPSFFEEHMEALFLVTGIGLGCWLASLAWKRR